MTTFRIENTTSGVVLGDYQGGTPTEALDAMARDAGYTDYADLCEEVPVKDGEIIVMPVTRAYPVEVAREVALRRPDLTGGDAIAVVLTNEPSLTADEVIEVLDEANAEWTAEVAAEREQQAREGA